MRAMVARKLERTRLDRGVADLFRPGGRRQEREAEEGSAPHPSIMLFGWPTASSSPTSSPIAHSPATSSRSFRTAPAFRIARCRPSRANSTSPRPPSFCPQGSRSTPRTCASSRRRPSCLSPAIRRSARPRCSRACAASIFPGRSCSRKASGSSRSSSRCAAGTSTPI